MVHDVIIDGIRIPNTASLALSQTFDKIGGRSLRRKLNGAAVVQQNWLKYVTTIEGSGRLPEGLAGVNTSTPVYISCAAPLSTFQVSNVFTLPVSRRTDFPPFGYAVVAGDNVATPAVLVGNTLTLTTVPGAQGYIASYYPILYAIVHPPSMKFNAREVQIGWSVKAEEV